MSNRQKTTSTDNKQLTIDNLTPSVTEGVMRMISKGYLLGDIALKYSLNLAEVEAVAMMMGAGKLTIIR